MRNRILFICLFFQIVLFVHSFALPAPINGMIIFMQAPTNNSYVSVNASNILNVANTTLREPFRITVNSDGTVSFQSISTSRYVAADYNLSPPQLIANRTAIGVWEKFKLLSQGGNVFALQSYNGAYVCADYSLPNFPLNANRTAIGPWEKFNLALPFSLPAKLDLATWAIQYSVNTCGEPVLPYSFQTRDAFKSALTSNIASKYPSISFSWPCQFNEGQASLENFVAPAKDACEFVFFVGHGGQYEAIPGYMGNANDAVFLNGTNCTDSWNAFTIGGNNTKWAFLEVCQGMKNRDATVYLPMLNGAHAVFGFQSKSQQWQWKSGWWSCITGCVYSNSWDKWTYFHRNWFSGQNMWTAYSNAVTQNQNEGSQLGSLSGLEYAMVQVVGQAMNNNGNWQTVFGGMETITNTYSNPMYTHNAPGWNYIGVSYVSTVIGTPSYK
jgi:hypothetical protein